MLSAPDYAASLIRSLGFSRPQAVEVYVSAVMPLVDSDGGEARIERRDSTRMVVNRSLSPERRAWKIAQSFAGWAMREDGWSPEDVRAVRSQVAAALLMPEDVVVSVLRAHDHRAAARALRVPVASLYMREGEVLEVPTAVVMPSLSWARVAGDPGRRLPAPEELLAVAHLPTLGIEKVATPDGEIVLRARSASRSVPRAAARRP